MDELLAFHDGRYFPSPTYNKLYNTMRLNIVLMLALNDHRNKLLFMIDRDEMLRIRIDNYLDRHSARFKKVSVGLGTLVARQVTQQEITVGAFAKTRREIRQYDDNFFIEFPVHGSDTYRQLWLPVQIWRGIGILPQREIVATESSPAERFAAWQDAQVTIHDVEDYSAYDPENQALYEEARGVLDVIGANDSSFGISVEVE